MASRHEIVSIDFRANASKANPAMDSLRMSAHEMRTEIEKTQKAISDGIKTGLPQAELDKLGQTLTAQERKLRSFETAMASLSKGVGTLSRAIDAFNTGTLNNMSAAFQKASYNAAENAKKALIPGSNDYEKSMAELDALQQKNLENLAKYKLRTEQMLQSIGEGGKISTQDLKQEAEGIQELMRLLPHMSHEWLEYSHILKQVNEAVKQQSDNEQRLKGAIVDANDARERSRQLTRDGAAEAARQREEAEEEVSVHKKAIDALMEEREEKQKQVSETAAVVVAKDKEIDKQRKLVAGIKDKIDNEEKDAKATQKKIDKLNEEADAYDKTAKANREAVETMKGEIKDYDDKLKDVEERLAKLGSSKSSPASSTAGKATGDKEKEVQTSEKAAEAGKKEEQASKAAAAAKKEETKASEEKIVAKEKEVKASETSVKAAEYEKMSADQLKEKAVALRNETDELIKKRDALTRAQKEGVQAVEAEARAAENSANAFANLSKEQAQAMLDQKKATLTKGGDGKFSYTNAEDAQHFLIESIKAVNPKGVNGDAISLGSVGVTKVRAMFKERFGLESDDDALAAIRGLISGDNGSLIKGGMMNNVFSRIDLNGSKVTAYSKEIKDLTDVINGEVKAINEESEAKKNLEKINQELADVNRKIEENDKEGLEIFKLRKKMQRGAVDVAEDEKEKTEDLNASRKKTVEILKQTIEAYKTLSAEQAKAEVETMKGVSKVGFKAGKLDVSNLEEVQNYLITKARAISGKKGGSTISLKGGQTDKLLEAFASRYGWTEDMTKAKSILKQIIQGKDGLFKDGGFANLSGADADMVVTIKQNTEAVEKRNAKMQTLTAIAEGAAASIGKVTKATKDDTAAIEIWGQEVARRKQRYDEMNADLEKAEQHLKNLKRQKSSLPNSGADAALLRDAKDREIEEYKESTYNPLKRQTELLKKSWDSSLKDYMVMTGQEVEETKKLTDAQNEEAEATDNSTKSRRRKNKAVEETTAAVKEEAKAEGESAKQSEKLSAEEQQRLKLEEERQELEAKRGETLDKIAKKTEEADGLEVKANNNREEAKRKTEEQAKAHDKNAESYAKETEALGKLEDEQGKLAGKLREGREELEKYNTQIDEHAEKQLKAEQKQAQTQRMTVDTMTEAIRVLETRNRAIEPESKEWQENTRLIQQYRAEIDRLKQQPVLQMMTERMGNIKNLSAEALAETKKFWEQMAAGAERGSHKLSVYEGNLRVIAEEERQRQQQIQVPMRQRLNNIGNLSTADLTETKRYWQTVRDGADQTTAAYKKAELAVKALTNEENRRKANAQAQYINDQMKDLSNLSVSGLAEVKRYWQAMADGAKRGSNEAKEAAKALKDISEVERASDKRQVRTLFGDLSKKNGEDIRGAIDAAKRLIDTYDSGSPVAKRLSQAIVDAEEHLKQYGVEAERAARREQQAIEDAMNKRKEQDALMRQQLKQGTSLSESALKQQEQYWRRLIDDPKTAKESLAGYRYELEKTIDLQRQQANTTRDERAARISDPRQFDNYSTAELREGIEAAKQLAASYHAGSDEAIALTKNIIAAEEHVNKYSLETERAAKKQQDEIRKMQDQLAQGTDLTESALKAQESYWRRLADEPGLAANKVKEYIANMKEAQDLQTQLTAIRGEQTLNKAKAGGYDTAGMASLDEAIKKLKAYQALIKDPLGAGKETFSATKEQIDALTAKLNTLKGVAEKVKGTFADADEVIKRFNESLEGTKVITPAQSIDEQLSQHTSVFDDDIKRWSENVDHYEKQIKEANDELREMQQELDELEKKHANSSWLRKKTLTYRHEPWQIEDLRDQIEGHDVTMDDGTTFRTGKKEMIKNLEGFKQDSQDHLDYYKQQKAEALGLTEIEEKLQESRRMTREEMQEGIKVLEAEAFTTDRTTENGQKRWEELRQTIDRMNAEIKESAGEWMTLADAEKLAASAGKEGFHGTAKELQMAEQALQRAATTAKKGSPEWERYRKGLERIKVEMQNMGMTSERMQEVLRNPSAANNLNELKDAIKRAKAELALMNDTVGESSEEYEDMAKQTKKAEQRLKELESQSKGTASSFEKAWQRLKTYIAFYVSAAAAMQKLMGTMGDLMELSDKLGEVRKTTGLTADEVGRLSDNLSRMDVRTPLVQLLEISAAAGQLGLKSTEDIQGFTEAANKLMIALPEMGKEAATEMMRVAIATGEVDKIRKQMQEGTIEGGNATAVAMEKIASTIDRLRASSASTAPEITDFVKRVGAVGAQSGISIDQVAALGSTVSSLGMRVEMSATALSRMIPAIKNNAFAVAKAIGVTPETLRNLFDTGRAMEAILLIFQHIKDQGMDEDSVEKMLGLGGMQEVMKELNQMGARAGIVFAGLSQNVDELRRQLGVAGQAYEENIAIQQEFDKMNETTAAKWERLKNEIEEAFVGDSWQSSLGTLIDMLRALVNFITGNVSPALRALSDLMKVFLVYWAILKMGIGKAFAVDFLAGIKAMGGGLTNLIANTKQYMVYSKLLSRAQLQLKTATDAASTALAQQKIKAIEARMAQEGLNKAMIANIWTAAAAAVMYLVYAMYKWIDSTREAAKEAGRFEAEVQRNIKAANKMIDAIGESRVKIEDADKAVRKARKELEAAKEANDGTAEAVKRLKDAEANLLVQEEKKRIAMSQHKQLIEQFNSQYSKYLGFMLSEVSSNLELANARDLVNSKLRETITLKQKEAALERVEKEKGEGRDERYGYLKEWVYRQVKDPTKAARVMQQIAEAANRNHNSLDEFTEEVRVITRNNKLDIKNLKPLYIRAKSYYRELQEIKEANDDVITQFSAQEAVGRKASQKNLVEQVNSAFRTYNSKLKSYQSAKGDDRAKAAAAVLQQMDTLNEMQQSAGSYYKLDDKKEEARYKKQMGNLITWKGYDRDALLKDAGKYYTPRKTTDGGTTSGSKDTTNPWGSKLPAESTDWKNMSAEALVERRKQMNKFVNAIQTDSDVKAVLAEDAALKKAIENGMSSDMRTVIEWYNTERLKIQDELHARHLTNTGDWRDPKKQKSAHKQFKAELDAYLEELDAYYTERKQQIEKARGDEEITEGEAWRRNLKNENEWHRRRAELQKLYGEKSAEVTQEEQDAIYHIIAERTGDSEKFVQQMIGKTINFAKKIEKTGEKGAAMVHKWRADLGLGWERDFLKVQQSVGKQVKFIEDTLAKERPYDSITKNLQDNLDKMGVLAAEYRRINDELTAQGKDPKYSNADITAQSYKEMAFYLKNVADAYTMDVNELLRRMTVEGMTETAKAIEQSDMLKQAVMGQLRKTYQEVQDAVKKESSQIKKDVELIWNDDTLGVGGKSMKSAFDKAIAQLGMQQDSVSRANSLIGAGVASDNVASRIAIKQIEVQMRMQKAQFDMFRVQANKRIAALHAEAEEHERIAKLMKQEGNMAEFEREILAKTTAERDADNVRRALGLTLAEETKKEEAQKAELLKLQEESQNRLFRSLKEWADLLSSSVQSLYEANHAGDTEYYNELAKLELTGKGGPGAGTYIVIEDQGTSDAEAHYEYLSEREALERQHEIEQENARAEAWRKLFDDVNQKMNDMITDQINAMVQNASIDANTDATTLNTQALGTLSEQLSQGISIRQDSNAGDTPKQAASGITDAVSEFAFGKQNLAGGDGESSPAQQQTPVTYESTGDFASDKLAYYARVGEAARAAAQEEINASDSVRSTVIKNNKEQEQSTAANNKKEKTSTQSSYAAMISACNMYGLAYQTVTNDNMSASEKFQMFALQAAGQAAIGMLTTDLFLQQGKAKLEYPGILGKAASQLGPIAGPVAFAAMTALLGGLMGMAVSQVSKSKSQIAQVTGASSASAGKLSTGMLTYATGNVNEFTDPSSLTPGRQYNVDAADGRTYRARYMGNNPRTHITNGPEFHLSGEKGREMIIDAGTTRQITMNESEIWHTIQTLSSGGRIRRTQRKGMGVRAFADGNVDDFEEIDSVIGDGMTPGGMSSEQMAAFQSSLDRNNELLERALSEGIHARFDVYGKGGLIDSYDRGKKNANRHGEKY